MADTNDNAPHTWVVLDQEQTIGRLPDRSYGPVMRVTFRTGAGIVRSVEIPAADYNAGTVRARLDEAAAETDAIQNL